MGVIAKQSITNTIFSYLGIVVGAVYTLFLIPEVFNQNPDEWGLIQLLFSFVYLFMPFALSGTSNIIIKFWPKFPEKERNNFAAFLLFMVITGLTVVSAIVLIFKNAIFFSKSGDNILISEYYLWFFPVFYIHTLFHLFISYSRVFYKTSLPTFLKDPFLKFWTAFLIIIYWQKLIPFDYFFKLYFLGTAFQLILIYIYLKTNTTLRFPINFSFIKNKKNVKEILTYGSFSLLAGGAAVLVSRIDLLMISKLINLKEVAYYSIALFFISVLQIPVRSIGTIAVPVLSEHLNNKDYIQVENIYKKIAQNILVIGSFILLIITLNINEFMQILGEKFGQVKYVVIILGISKVYEMIHSPNGSVIIISKYYKYDIVFQIILLIVTIITNLIFIPLYGINGAALATAITMITNVTVKELFIYSKYKLHPYGKQTLAILATAGVSILLTIFIPDIYNVYITMIIKGLIISIIYLISLFTLNISDDMKQMVISIISSIRK
jgi:O-antigen/teichoic acid export membrane protein